MNASAKTPYQSLAPTDLGDKEYERYRGEFEFIVREAEITNIALSGPYGAGKSSVIRTWEKRSDIKGWTYVSLADFGREPGRSSIVSEDEFSLNDFVENSGDKNQLIREREISSFDSREVEAEILNQLMYGIDASQAPKSRFVVTKDREWYLDAIASALVLSMIVLTVAGIYFVANRLPLVLSGESELSLWSIALFLLWFLGAGYGIYREVRHRRISRIFKRMKLFDAELELHPMAEDSVFDKYMDDVVYLLSSSSTNMVVFEDIDRFGDILVFERLRRINVLANERRKSDMPLRFVYLVRDSLFVEPHERTKFFDYIVPVIPYVDPSNSADILKEGFDKAGIKIEDSFLYRLSLFIDDPRIIKDICNETVHFRRALFELDESLKDGDIERLIAMVTVKVLFPAEYENLQRRRGYIFSVFGKRKEYVAKNVESYTSEINELRGRIEEEISKASVSEKELTLLALLTRREFRESLNGSCYVSGNFTTVNGLYDKIFEEGSSSKRSAMSYLRNLGDTDLHEKVEGVRANRDEKIRLLNSEIDLLKGKVVSASDLRLSELATDANGEIFDISKDDLCRSEDYYELKIESLLKNRYLPLLKYLIASGWLDESYERYMSYHHEGLLTFADKEFVTRCLQPNAPSDFYVNIDNPLNVLMSLARADCPLSRRCVRSKVIFDTLAENPSLPGMEDFIQGVVADKDYRFVASYVVNGTYKRDLVVRLDSCYSEWVNDALADIAGSDSSKRMLCRTIMGREDCCVAVRANAEIIGGFSSSDPLFLHDVEDSIPMRDALQIVGYRPDDFDVDGVDHGLLEYVIEKRLYAPTSCLVEKFLKSQGLLAQGRSVSDSLALHQLSAVSVHVRANIGCYLESLLADGKALISDTDEGIAFVLNSEGIPALMVQRYAESIARELSDLSSIEDVEMKSALLAAGKVTCNEANVIDAMEHCGFNDALFGMIENKGWPETLDGERLKEAGFEPRDILLRLAMSEIVSDDVLEEVCGIVACSFAELGESDLGNERMGVFVKTGSLLATGENLNMLREEYEGLVVEFAERNIDGYLDLISPDDGNVSICEPIDRETLLLMDSDVLSDKKRAALADLLIDSAPMKTSYPELVNIRLLDKEKISNDVDVPSYFEFASIDFKKAIAQYMASPSRFLTWESLPRDVELEIARTIESVSDKKKFVTRRLELQGKKCTRMEVRGLLSAAGLSNYCMILEGFRFRVDGTAEDSSLVAVLHELGMCGKAKAIKSGELSVFPKKTDRR